MRLSQTNSLKQFLTTYTGTRIADVAIPSLSDGNTVYVEYTTLQTGSISINLVQDDQNAPLHIGARYDHKGSRNVLVVNSLQNYQWKNEERPPWFPFDSGYFTSVKIVPSSEASAYKIYANGKHIYDFKYRWAGTPDKVKRVYVITENVSQPVQVTQLMVI